MRKLVGIIAILAAGVIIIYSAATLSVTAYSMQSVWYFQYLFAIGAGAVVLFEASLAWNISQAWKHKEIGFAIFGTILLLAAIAWTARLELHYYVAGQADKVVAKDDDVERRAEIKAQIKAKAEELSYAPAGRAASVVSVDLENVKAHKRFGPSYTIGCNPAHISAPESIALCDRYRGLKSELANAKTRDRLTAELGALITRRDAIKARAKGMPEAQTLSRWTGWEYDTWVDILMICGIVFWALARPFAVPLALMGFAALKKPKAQETNGLLPEHIPKGEACEGGVKPVKLIDSAATPFPMPFERRVRNWLGNQCVKTTTPAIRATEAHGAFMRSTDIQCSREEFGEALTAIVGQNQKERKRDGMYYYFALLEEVQPYALAS